MNLFWSNYNLDYQEFWCQFMLLEIREMSTPYLIAWHLSETLSGKVNWETSGALQPGQWTGRDRPQLPGNLSWERPGLKVLGAFIRTKDFEKKNWGRVMEKVCSKRKWMLPQHSYRDRVLIVHNLVILTRTHWQSYHHQAVWSEESRGQLWTFSSW